MGLGFCWLWSANPKTSSHSGPLTALTFRLCACVLISQADLKLTIQSSLMHFYSSLHKYFLHFWILPDWFMYSYALKFVLSLSPYEHLKIKSGEELYITACYINMPARGLSYWLFWLMCSLPPISLPTSPTPKPFFLFWPQSSNIYCKFMIWFPWASLYLPTVIPTYFLILCFRISWECFLFS